MGGAVPQHLEGYKAATPYLEGPSFVRSYTITLKMQGVDGPTRAARSCSLEVSQNKNVQKQISQLESGEEIAMIVRLWMSGFRTPAGSSGSGCASLCISSQRGSLDFVIGVTRKPGDPSMGVARIFWLSMKAFIG